MGAARLNLLAVPQAGQQSEQPLRLPFRPSKHPLPSLPPIPPVKPGGDPISNLGFLWVNEEESHKVAKLLYIPLIRGLKQICPEVDWGKLKQWTNHYKLRRRTRDYKSYLRREDVESFIDFMLKFHPVNTLGDRAPVLNEVQLETELANYFKKWDLLLAKERLRRETGFSAINTPPTASSDATSPGSELLSTSAFGCKPSSPTASQGAQDDFRASSTDISKKMRLEIPEKRRLLIGRISNEAIERVTRAMIAIHNMNSEDTPKDGDAPNSAGRRATFANVITPLLKLKAASEGNLKSLKNNDNPPKAIETTANTEGQPHPESPCSHSPEGGVSLRGKSSSLPRKERDAMRAYLIAREESTVNDANNDTPQHITRHHAVDESQLASTGTTTHPRAASAQQLRSGPETIASGISVTDPNTRNFAKLASMTLGRSSHQSRSIWQPTPVSPRTKAKLYDMHDYPEYNSMQSILHSNSGSNPKLQHRIPPSAQLTPADLLKSLMDNATPIGPDTTPHLAMFAEQRREKERKEQDALMRQLNIKDA
ncbi:hypothetical protein DRE_01449 [Drechslerella stenobrocha 248]|uniref:Uncharacterized protein n=1 Tax=Drechslerella stenobrocha 248 TaxID=1043628 RepID=W7HU24_9PEZI|nr:hypothetical protein DRE_01449 [Drechslerella stenobrocha 248]